MKSDKTGSLFAEVKEPLPSVTLTADGACQPNPGNGGWCALLSAGSKRLVVSGCEPNTTNNRMEMKAVLEGLRALKRRARVLVRSDSQIVIGLLNRRGKKPAKRANQDLVIAIIAEMEKHEVRAEWVRGHNGDPENEECDRIAESLARTGTAF